MASQSTFSRFFKKFDRDLNDKIFPAINRFWFDQVKLDKLTIDFDSTVLVRHGMQGGVVVGYNPKKPGRGSHHPLMAFVAEIKMVANAWMRTGDTVASSEFEGFFNELLTIIPKERIGLVRADSGFYGKDMLSQFEDSRTNYIVAAKMNRGLVQRIYDQRAWFPQDDGYLTSSFHYKAHGWSAFQKDGCGTQRCMEASPNRRQIAFPGNRRTGAKRSSTK
jgi:hypothetical protein